MNLRRPPRLLENQCGAPRTLQVSRPEYLQVVRMAPKLPQAAGLLLGSLQAARMVTVPGLLGELRLEGGW